MDEDFVFFKVDMQNAFNVVSRQAVFDECATFSPELIPWVSWCYGFHPMLWHPLGQICSEYGVQQGDPLNPLLFALVLHKLVASLEADDQCFDLLLQAWYLDDGGSRPAVLRAVHLIEMLGPAVGLHVNLAKCELFSRKGNTSFPPDVRCSLLAQIGYPQCTNATCSNKFSFSLLLVSVQSPGSCCLCWWMWLQSISR